MAVYEWADPPEGWLFPQPTEELPQSREELADYLASAPAPPLPMPMPIDAISGADPAATPAPPPAVPPAPALESSVHDSDKPLPPEYAELGIDAIRESPELQEKLYREHGIYVQPAPPIVGDKPAVEPGADNPYTPAGSVARGPGEGPVDYGLPEGSPTAPPPLPWEDRGRQLASMGVEDYAAEKARFEKERRESLAFDRETEVVRRENNARADFEAHRRSQENYAAELADVRARVAEHAGKKAEGSWWRDRTTGQKISGLISAGLGGMLRVALGQRGNSTLEMIDREISRDLAEQQADLAREGQGLAQEQGIIAQEMKRDGDLYRAIAVARQASWARVDQELNAKAAQYDPDGTAAFHLAEMSRGAKAKIAKIAAETEQQIYERSKSLVEAMRKENKDRADAEHQRGQRSLGWAADKRAKERLALDEAKAAAADALKREELEAKKETDEAKKEGVEVQATLINPATLKPAGVSRVGMHDPKRAKEIQGGMVAFAGARKELADYARRLKAVGSTYGGPGGGWNAVRSQDKADLDALHLRIATGVARSFGGPITESDIEVAKKLIPGPESWLQRSNPSKTLDLAIDSLNSKHRHELAPHLTPAEINEYMESLNSQGEIEAVAPPPEGTPEGALTKEALRPEPSDAPIQEDSKGRTIVVSKGLAAKNRQEWEANRTEAISNLATLAKSGNGDALSALHAIAGNDARPFASDLAEQALKDLKK